MGEIFGVEKCRKSAEEEQESLRRFSKGVKNG
jgi:hypothetical protein